MKIKLFKPYVTGNEIKYIGNLIEKGMDMSGDGFYTKKVQKLMEERYGVNKVLLTTSGTTALEMAVRLLNLKKGDEIIAPSFTFSSTINAILMSQGLKVVFAEIEKETLNIDPNDIERKITRKTKAIMVVHYAGVACDMDRIMSIAKRYELQVVEDAAQAIESKYKGKYLGTIGDFGCLSFHDTKNITCGEGGALFINTKNKATLEKAEVIREKGTNRSKFFRGEIDKYTWVEMGSSYLPSDILAAYLYAQMEQVEKIIKLRRKVYDYYFDKLSSYSKKGIIQIPTITRGAEHNSHIFYIIFKTQEERNFVMDFFKANEVSATFHYIPLHSAPKGMQLGYKPADLPLTESLAGCLLRLPIYSSMKAAEYRKVVKVFIDAINVLEKRNEAYKFVDQKVTYKTPFFRNILSSIQLC